MQVFDDKTRWMYLPRISFTVWSFSVSYTGLLASAPSVFCANLGSEVPKLKKIDKIDEKKF